jgi:hypothetical protein
MPASRPITIALLLCLLFTLTAFSALTAGQAFSQPDSISPEASQIAEENFISEMESASARCEYALIAILETDPSAGCVPVIAAEFDSAQTLLKKESSRAWFSIFYSAEHWLAAADSLSERASNLLLVEQPSAGQIAKNKNDFRAVTLLFQFPRQQRLNLGGVQVLLSEEAQRYLTLERISDYPASQRVLIIEEPHYEADTQYSLYKGLEILFADNPHLLTGSRVVFLAEGCTAGERLSVRPLVNAAPRPDDGLIGYLLGTYLIPAYVAYEWKHQQGIEIIGLEDPLLYQSSARLWAEMQSNQEMGPAALWPQTVAARNGSMVRTLLAQLERRKLPILFMGGLHMEPLSDQDRMSSQRLEQFSGLLRQRELGSLQAADRRSVTEMLQERGIGFYRLVAHSNPLPEEGQREREIAQYARLFQAQLNGEMEGYLRALPGPGEETGVTVAPAPQAAAMLISMHQAAAAGTGSGEGSGEKKDGKKDGGKGGKGGGGNGGGAWSSLKGKLKDFLGSLGKAARLLQKVPQAARSVLQCIREHGRQPSGHVGGGKYENRDGKLPPGGDYREYDVNPRPRGARDKERIVVDWSGGKPGKAWYTPDHYDTFYPMQ